MGIQIKTLELAISEAQTQLTKMVAALEQFQFPSAETIIFEPNNIDVDEIVKVIPTGSSDEDYIYIFKVYGKNNSNRDFIRNLQAEKNKPVVEKKKDLPRINESHKGTQYLYVGRSQKLRSRIRQHLGSNYIGTYGLHMERWSQNLTGKVEIQYFKLTGLDNLLVQSVEDSLWMKLRPAFGRKGDK